MRELGFIESLVCLENELAPSSSNVVGIIQVHGKLDLSLIKEAIYALFHRHPLLQCTIHKKENAYVFDTKAKIEDIPLRIAKRTKLDLWKEVIEDEIQELFPIDKYLWKLIILEDPKIDENDILVVFHHSITDGLSTFRFFEELLNVYSIFLSKGKPKLEKLPLLPPIEKMIQKQKTESEYQNQLKQMPRIKISEWEHDQMAPQEQRKSKNIFFILDENKLGKIKKRAKSNGVTINSVINAAMTLAFARQYDHPINLSISTPVNLRPYCDPALGPEHLGCFISIVPTTLENVSGNSLFWSVAKSYEKEVKETIKTLGFFPTDFHLSSIHHLLPETNQSENTILLSVTNLGDLGEASKIHSFFFTTSQRRAIPTYLLHLNTLNKHLHLCLTYTYPLTSKESAKNYFQLCLEILDEIA